MSHQEPTIATILRLLAAEYDGPIEERRVLERVLERRPSSAKNPYATIRERLRWDGLTLGWLRLNRRQLVPLRIVLQGLRFRCIPRSRDVAAGTLPLAHLQPFVGLRSHDLGLIDSEGRSQAFVDVDLAEQNPTGQLSTPGFDLTAWYQRNGFVAGDSILVMIVSAEPLVLQIEREPAADFHSGAVAAQDKELIEAIVERVNRTQTTLVPCDEVVLPIFAVASWRGSYPGSPWQHLVTGDDRLQLVDDIFLTNQRSVSLRLFSSDEVFEQQPVSEQDYQVTDAALLREIDQLQHDLRRSREEDADAGLWNGQIQRASAAYSTFDRFGEDMRRPGPSGAIDRFELDDDGLESWDPAEFFAEELTGLDTAALEEARMRMLAALPPGVATQLEQARPEDAELIIAQHLNLLLVREPSLFPKLVLEEEDSSIVDGDEVAPEGLFDTDWEEDWVDEDDWVDDDDDESLDEDSSVYAASSDLIAQFHDYLVEMGKSEPTARARARGLAAYAEFLASYYRRTLADGDYATLDECLFYYYPRRVLNNSPRQVREICTALKQFYAFLKERGKIGDDRFAQALWRRREQAARVVTLYDRISSDSPNFEALFARLFAPYTE